MLAKTLYGGRYELLELLGVGESGSVYRVRDVELDGLLAMKVLRKELVGDRETIALFKNEVRLARRVTSHSVARVYDIGEHDGEKYLTMELIDGESLTHRFSATVDGNRRPLPCASLSGNGRMLSGMFRRCLAFLAFPEGIHSTRPSSSMSRATRATTSPCRKPR